MPTVTLNDFDMNSISSAVAYGNTGQQDIFTPTGMSNFVVYNVMEDGAGFDVNGINVIFGFEWQYDKIDLSALSEFSGVIPQFTPNPPYFPTDEYVVVVTDGIFSGGPSYDAYDEDPYSVTTNGTIIYFGSASGLHYAIGLIDVAGEDIDLDNIILSSGSPPTVSDGNITIISTGSGTNGAYIVGDVIVASWNNTSAGDNNSGVTGVTMNFNAFGGGTAVVANDSGDGTWTASYTVIAGGIDLTNRNVSVTATNAHGPSTTSDTTNLTIDNMVPIVTDASISISGATGTSGVYKAGDTVTATWNNTGSGDNNSDAISSVAIDFSDFGGGTVAASNSSGTWTATYVIQSGLTGINRNVAVTVTDNAGNSTLVNDTSNATIEADAPTVVAITRQGAATTNADTIGFTVEFSEATANVTANDFVVTGASSGGAVTDITTSDNIHYDVTIGGGNLDSYNGFVGINFAPGQNITDTTGNALTNTGASTHQYVTLDNVGPVLQSITRSSPAGETTGDDTLTFTAQFDDTVYAVDNSDFVVTGGSGASVTTSNIGGGTVLVHVSGGSLANYNDTVGIELASGATITDAAGNNATAALTVNESYQMDNVAPTLVSIERLTPSAANTNADSLTFRVSFDSDVQGVGGQAFVLNGSTATLSNVSAVNDSLYDLTYSGGDLAALNGTVSLSLAQGHSITDLASNAVANSSPMGVNESYTVDNLAPAATITRYEPSGQATRADSVVFTVSFDQVVSGVTTGSFTVTGGSTAIVSNVASAGGNAYTVTVSGGDLASFEGSLGLDLSNAHGIADTAGNPAIVTSAATYTIDNTPLTLQSITLADDSLTNADSLGFTLQFDGPAANIDANDFVITGGATGTIDLTDLGGGSYTVTAHGGNLDTFEGAVGIALSSNADITDLAGNILQPFTGSSEDYTLDNSAPELLSIVRADSELTHSDTLVFHATFSEDIVDIDLTSFAVVGSTAEVTGVNDIGGGVYEIEVSGGDLASLNGSVSLELYHWHEIEDVAGNDLPTTQPSQSQAYTVDNVAPLVQSITRGTPADEHTNADTLVFQVAFSDPVSGVDAGDFTVSGTTASVTAVAETGNGTGIFNVTVSGGDLASLDGSVTLGFSGGQTITDMAGNALVNTTPTGLNQSSYIVDNTLGQLQSITRISNAQTRDDVISFTVQFDAPVVGFDAGDISVTGGALAEIDITDQGNGTYEVSLYGGDLAGFDGPVGIALSSGATVTDRAGNALASLSPSGLNQTITLDNTAPELLSIERADPADIRTNADTLVFNATFSEEIVDIDLTSFAVVGSTAEVTAVDDLGNGVYSIEVSGGDLATVNGGVSLELYHWHEIEDVAGNDLPDTQPVVSEAYVVDNAAPTVVAILRAGMAGADTNADTLVFQIQFNEAMSGLSALDLTLTGTTATITSVVETGAGTYDVTVSGGNLAALNGDVSLAFRNDASVGDVAGNVLVDFTPGIAQDYSVDNIAPNLLSIERATPLAEHTNADTVSFTVTFDGPVTVEAGDFAVTGGSTATVTNVTSHGGIVTVEVGGGDLANYNGALGISLAIGNAVADAAGNALDDSIASGSQGYVIDNAAPELVSIERLADEIVNTASVVFRASFDDVVTGVSANSFAVTGGSTATVSGFHDNGDGSYDVTVSGGDLAGYTGNVGLQLDTLAAVEDAAGNVLTDFDAGSSEDYIVDHEGPTIQSARVSGGVMILTFGDHVTLDAAHPPAAGAFTVTLAGVSVQVASVSINATDKTATLTLGTPAKQGQVVLVGYSDPTIEDDSLALQDASGNDAAGFTGFAVTNHTVSPPAPPAVTTIDGLPVTTETKTGSDGQPIQVTTIPVYTATRVDDTGNQDRADIPLSGDKLVAHLPLGAGLTVDAPLDGASGLIAAINATAGQGDAAGMAGNGQIFLDALNGAESDTLITRTIKPVVGDDYVPGTPITFSRPETDGADKVALVIDASDLPPGVVIELQGIDFVAVVGDAEVRGGTGVQIVSGDSGSQLVQLGQDDDQATAGEGDDMVYGNQADDVVYGNQGVDTLYGGQDDDLAFGGQDNDIAYGNKGDDVVYGNKGEDVLFGGQADDVLYGGQGDDTLDGGVGDDTLTGGLGADDFLFDTDKEGSSTLTDFDAGEDAIFVNGEETGFADDFDANAYGGPATMNIGPGGVFTFTVFSDFDPGASVIFTLTGENATWMMIG